MSTKLCKPTPARRVMLSLECLTTASLTDLRHAPAYWIDVEGNTVIVKQAQANVMQVVKKKAVKKKK